VKRRYTGFDLVDSGGRRNKPLGSPSLVDSGHCLDFRARAADVAPKLSSGTTTDCVHGQGVDTETLLWRLRAGANPPSHQERTTIVIVLLLLSPSLFVSNECWSNFPRVIVGSAVVEKRLKIRRDGSTA
jgi:hypothetical protein